MQNAERRLSAILCADVVGYSRLVRTDETGTLARLNEARSILHTAVEENGGRVFNLAGDGLLAEFPSAVAAVQAAAGSQDRLAVWAANQPDECRMDRRIGVNLADVVVDGNDLLGDGVNVAARLQALAEPGGVCISGAVYEQTRGRLALEFIEFDQQPLKNIADPIRVYALRSGVDPSVVGNIAVSGPATTGGTRRNPRRARVLRRLAGIVVIIALLLVINLLTTPHRIWIHWPALGMGAALVLSELRRWLWGHPWFSDRLPD
jgi:adenylate cyclase